MDSKRNPSFQSNKFQEGYLWKFLEKSFDEVPEGCVSPPPPLSISGETFGKILDGHGETFWQFPEEVPGEIPEGNSWDNRGGSSQLIPAEIFLIILGGIPGESLEES